jgi:uncharacterized membrane protein YgdD (TMEM256/DUF423 family)
MAKHGLWIGALMGLLAVLLGAFGTHGVENLFPEGEFSATERSDRLKVWYIANRYLMWHALVSLVVGIMGQFNRHKMLEFALWSFIGGSCLFSGFLYLYALTGQTWMMAIVPLGGVLFVIGWGLLLLAGWSAVQPRKKKRKKEQTA